jgi:hypothetical protein
MGNGCGAAALVNPLDRTVTLFREEREGEVPAGQATVEIGSEMQGFVSTLRTC